MWKKLLKNLVTLEPSRTKLNLFNLTENVCNLFAWDLIKRAI